MYSNEELYAIQNSFIGFEFEFFSDTKKLDEIKSDLSLLLNKKIILEDKCHSDFNPDRDTFKMEPDNSGGTGMIEFITGPCPYPEAKLILAKTLNYIKTYGYNTARSSIHVNVSFDTKKLGEKANISKLDIGKYILNFDEDYVYKLFPNRKDSVYAKSIKYIMPYDMTLNSPEKILWKNYLMVNTKYYGINFTKTAKGYLEFRYLGGVDYCKKYSKIITLVEYFLVSLYNTLANPAYTKNDLDKLDKVIEEHKFLVKALESYETFKLLRPEIGITVDLDTNEQHINMYWSKLKPKLYDIVIKNKMKKGIINYDADTSKVQIKDAEILDCFEIEGIDIVNCIIQGNLVNCDIFTSTIKNSCNTFCNFFNKSKVISSKIENCYVSKGVECEDCYVFGKNGVFSGHMTSSGIFREGRITKFAKFDKSVEIIEREKI